MRIIQRLSEIQNLPTLPEIVLRIQELIMSEEGNAALLSRIIEQDPALTAKILKVANSSYYCSVNGKISSVNLAITRIGFNEIGHIALAVNFVRTFSQKSNILDYKRYWKHSLAAAYLTSMIGEYAGNTFSRQDKHYLFLAGLLHDIGILMYDQFYHPQFENIIETALKKETSFLEAEHEAVPNETHAILGSILLDLWKISPAIVSAVRFHHAPENAPEMFRPMAYAAYLAEYLLCNSALGSFEGSIEAGQKNVLNTLGLTHEMTNEFIIRTDLEVERSELVYALDNDSSRTHFKAV